jgi:hypothetical protein
MKLDFPMQLPVVDRVSLLLTKSWADWFIEFFRRTTTVYRQAGKPNTAAAIPATALVPSQRGVNFLRVTYNLRVTQAPTTSGSVQLSLAWTDVVTQTFTGAALTGLGVQMQSVLMHADCAQPTTYAVAYNSVGTTPLQYTLDLVVEQVSG